MFFVYILHSASLDNYLYVGQTQNLAQRLQRHNNREVLSTKNGGPWTIIWYTQKTTRAEALKLEKYLKSLSRKRKLEFIQKYKTDL